MLVVEKQTCFRTAARWGYGTLESFKSSVRELEEEFRVRCEKSPYYKLQIAIGNLGKDKELIEVFTDDSGETKCRFYGYGTDGKGSRYYSRKHPIILSYGDALVGGYGSLCYFYSSQAFENVFWNVGGLLGDGESKDVE